MKTTIFGILFLFVSQASFAAGVTCFAPSGLKINFAPKSKNKVVYSVVTRSFPERAVEVQAEEVFGSEKASIVKISSKDETVEGTIVSKVKVIKIRGKEIKITEISAKILDKKLVSKYSDLDGETTLSCK